MISLDLHINVNTLYLKFRSTSKIKKEGEADLKRGNKRSAREEKREEWEEENERRGCEE